MKPEAESSAVGGSDSHRSRQCEPPSSQLLSQQGESQSSISGSAGTTCPAAQYSTAGAQSDGSHSGASPNTLSGTRPRIPISSGLGTPTVLPPSSSSVAPRQFFPAARPRRFSVMEDAVLGSVLGENEYVVNASVPRTPPPSSGVALGHTPLSGISAEHSSHKAPLRSHAARPPALSPTPFPQSPSSQNSSTRAPSASAAASEPPGFLHSATGSESHAIHPGPPGDARNQGDSRRTLAPPPVHSAYDQSTSMGSSRNVRSDTSQACVTGPACRLGENHSHYHRSKTSPTSQGSDPKDGERIPGNSSGFRPSHEDRAESSTTRAPPSESVPASAGGDNAPKRHSSHAKEHGGSSKGQSSGDTMPYHCPVW